jgi:hypothetical protein
MVCRRGVYWVWWGNVRESGYLEDVDINAKIILKWGFSMWYGEVLTVLIWPRTGAGGGR